MINNENGRSMVEMLGVLAIIGVLSVAGIAGYTMAMKKYRANEIINTASQLAILARAADAGNGACLFAGEKVDCATATDSGLPLPSGATKMQADCNATSCAVKIKVSSELVTPVSSGIGTSNGFYTATVTS